MHVLTAVNVNDAWAKAVSHMLACGIKQESRAGPVFVTPYPVTTVYTRPWQRVLFDPIRNANPFFHFFESLWMLAGRNDAEFLNQFVKDFGARFAEEDGKIHGAYGHRWRRHWCDQLDCVVEKLTKNVNDRQCVIAMWDPMYMRIDTKHIVGGDDLRGDWKDRPCNTHIYLSVRNNLLNMTVCCRSNDIVWGCYGANAVHFSMLLEYLAGRTGLAVGILYQISNNWHAYIDVFEKYVNDSEDAVPDVYPYGKISYEPIGNDWMHWDNDLMRFMSWTERGGELKVVNSWFANVAAPLFTAHQLYRKKDYESALAAADICKAADWRMAATQWINRRVPKHAEA